MKNRILNLLLVCLSISFLLVGCQSVHSSESNFTSNSSASITIQESSTALSSKTTTESIKATSNSNATVKASVETSKKTVQTETPSTTTATIIRTSKKILETGKYSTKDDVYKYISIYGKLPSNYITKDNAIMLGWKSSVGNLWLVTDKMSIGGDFFWNREGLLPIKSGRKYYECDINYYGGFRGAERIVYSNDGLIYYTSNHYKTFTRLGDN